MSNRPTNTLGASELPAVAGVDPYRTAQDVYLLKTGQVDEFEGNENTERGNDLEPVLLNRLRRKVGHDFFRQVVMHHPSGLLHATLDAITDNDVPELFIGEAKTSASSEGWGEDGTDDVPDRVIVQVHGQFACVGKEYRIAYVPVLIPGFRSFDFRTYKIHRNDRLVEQVETIGIEFMEAVRERRPPPVAGSLEVLNRIKREPMKRTTIPTQLVKDWWEANQARLAWEKLEADRKAELVTAMGDAELADFAENEGREIAFVYVKKANFSASRFKADHPDLYDQYVDADGGYRKLSLRKQKKQKKEISHVSLIDS